MVKAKDEPVDNVHWLTKVQNDIDQRHPIIDTRFFVEEVKPAYNTGGYYDQDVPEERKRVSPFFTTKSAAVKWMNEHEADKGKTLEVMKQNKRRTITERWWDARRIRL